MKIIHKSLTSANAHNTHASWARKLKGCQCTWSQLVEEELNPGMFHCLEPRCVLVHVHVDRYSSNAIKINIEHIFTINRYLIKLIRNKEHTFGGK